MEKDGIVSFINKTSIQYKLDHQFTTANPPTNPKDQVITVGEELFKSQNAAGTAVAPESLVTFSLPDGKTIDEYIAFVIENNPSGIGKAVKEGVNFNNELANLIKNDETSFAAKHLSNAKERIVSPSLSDLELMLHSNFKIENNKLVQIQDSTVKKDVENSLLKQMLVLSSLYKAYVYIPKDLQLLDFIRSVAPKNLKDHDKATDEVWVALMAAIKGKDEGDTRKVPFMHLLEGLSRLSYSKNNPDAIKIINSTIKAKSINISVGKTKINPYTDLSEEMFKLTYDKIYLDFGSLPVEEESWNDCEIVEDMIEAIMDSINSQMKEITFSNIIIQLQRKHVRVSYKRTFVDASILKPATISIKDINERVAEKLNSTKFQLYVTGNEVIEPPSESEFSRSNGNIAYVHKEFPNLKFQLTENELCLAYFNFVKGKVNSEQEEQKVREEFFKVFWSKETVAEFGTQLVQLDEFAKEEAAIPSKNDSKDDDDDDNDNSGSIVASGASGESGKPTTTNTTTTTTYSCSWGIPVGIVVVIGVFGIVLVVVIKKKKTKETEMKNNLI